MMPIAATSAHPHRALVVPEGSISVAAAASRTGGAAASTTTIQSSARPAQARSMPTEGPSAKAPAHKASPGNSHTTAVAWPATMPSMTVGIAIISTASVRISTSSSPPRGVTAAAASRSATA